jgi:hypothetical protein
VDTYLGDSTYFGEMLAASETAESRLAKAAGWVSACSIGSLRLAGEIRILQLCAISFG